MMMPYILVVASTWAMLSLTVEEHIKVALAWQRAWQ